MNELPNITHYISDIFKIEPAYVFFAIFLLTLTYTTLRNFNHIFDFLRNKKKIKIDNLLQALSSEHITNETKKYLQSQLSVEYFYINTGIRIEPILREALLKKYHETNGDIAFRHFQRVLPHVTFSKSNIFIRIYWIEYIFYYISNLISIISLSFIPYIAYTTYSLLNEKIDWLTALGIFGIMIFFNLICLAMALFMFWQTASIWSAKIILKHYPQMKYKKHKPS